MGKIRNENDRILWIDSAKGFVMLCVILGHMKIGRVPDIIIFSFHMPFYFLLDGYFFKPQRYMCKKDAKHLLIPYLFTGIVLILLTQVKNFAKIAFHIGNPMPAGELLIEWIKAVLLGSGGRTDFFLIHSDITVGAIWFLLAMFFARLITAFCLKRKLGFIWLAAATIAGAWCAKYFWVPLSIFPAAAAAGFIGIGYYCCLKVQSDPLLLIRPSIAIVCAILWAAYLFLCIHFDARLSTASAVYPWGVIDFLGATAASVVILWGSNKIVPLLPVAERFLSWIGENSLIVLCFHLIETKCIPFGSIIRYVLDMLSIDVWFLPGVLTYIAKIVWACCAIVLVKKLHPLRQIFGVKTER